MPTAFIAEYGSGYPVIGLLGEYDALPGLSQKVCAEKNPVEEGGNGHGCEHNLIGTGLVGTAVALQETMRREKLAGTIRYYGCPAEEQLIGKPMMAKEGVFDDLDIALSWHPEKLNQVIQYSSLAVKSVKFRFKGISAHAAMAPQLGRSALDAVEIMNVGANYLREHVVDTARIHYVITNGGKVPNAVPDDAEVWYMIRDQKQSMVEEITERLYKIAEGAALITETSVSHKILSSCYEMIINPEVSELIYKNMEEVGAPEFDDEDREFARQFTDQMSEEARKEVMDSYFAPKEVRDNLPLHDKIYKPDDWGKVMPGTFDHGDVSNIVPFGYMFIAGLPVGMPGHTWQVTACAGADMGIKAMMCAAKIMAGTVYDLLQDNTLVERAKASFEKEMNGRKYVSGLGD
ncbi:aminobenzoyl-glutamate utilization protein B [Hespellia stercorisuis DSM 15480]|uniref:Peptidase M20 domain-containing protein 2 n=2 Tax=Hespellia stercorisuis TaxID=180311 RepID=A0A1M6V3R4_9FIRM|nr:aminobenzoyl-glutamate utilization protein B [Hespellia stercorisuis DSM 15480]